MRKSTSKKKMLTAAVMTALLVTPGYSYAFKMAPEYVYYNGKPIAEMQFLAEGEGINNFVSQAEYTLSPSLIQPVKSSTAYWTGMIGPKAKNETPWQVFVTTEANQQNASAVTSSYVPGKGELRAVKTMFVPQQLQDGKKLLRMTKEIGESTNPPLGDYGFSVIYIGQYMGADRKGAIDGWWVDTDTVLPFNEQAADFVGTFRHELGHALGISKRFDYTEKPEAKGEYVIRFSTEVTDPDSWNLHLVDQNLNPAKPGMEILSAKGFAAKKNADPGVKERDFFIVNNDYKGEDASGKNGKAFFVGPHVTDALAGATFFGVNGVPVNSWEKDNFDGAHLQTAGMMSHRDYSNYTSFMEVELAVMQDLGYDIDREAYFGHSVYGDGLTITNTQGYFARNEAGTAYMEGKPSAVPLGIGLHIYGSRNTVIQAADILTTGTGATGVRVDGMQNTVVVPTDTNVQADGLRGNGILIAYGRDQVVNQAGTVTANGQGGTGIRFDFGSSSNGADDEYRGSYIRYKRSVEKGTGRITSSKNMNLMDMDEDVFNAGANELNGPQVTEYNLTGALSGGENAIYISKNAFVENINIKEGASIRGNITSDWKHFHTDGSYDGVEKTEKEYAISFEAWMAKNHPGVNPNPGDDATETELEAASQYFKDYEADPEVQDNLKTVTTRKGKLRIQYNGETGENGYEYDTYIPDLVTNLNFSAIMEYSGNITGRDNMKLNVDKGRLFYGGTADVAGVHVAEGATLFGGTYIVNDMTAYMPPGFSDDATGVFHNCGTIGAASQDTSMQITGRLVSDGVLLGLDGGTAGHIAVKGNANINGSLLAAEGMLPGDTYTVLTATEGISGTPENNSEKTAYRLGLLNETGSVSTDGAKAQVTAVAVNNLEGADEVQNETLEAMVAMSDALKANHDPRREEMRPLFSLSPVAAKDSLSAISANTSAKSMAVAQRSMMTHHILSSRLNEAFLPKPVQVELPSANLNDTAADGLAVSLNLLEPAENDIWLKFGKNWGDVQGNTDYHSSTTLLGYDKAVAPHWRVGAFAGYSSTSFSDNTASNELKDTRFGLYAGYNKAGKEALVFLDYGWMRNKLRRGITGLGLTANARYHSRILELGGEYLYDLHATKNVPWHVRPYVNAQLSRLWQDGYSEEGARVYNQVVDSKHNNYFDMGAGVEFKRYLPCGNYVIRAGVRHAFAGAEPKLRYSYMGNQANTYDMRNTQDKTHFVLSIGGETQIAKGWSIGGDASFTRGRHDKDWSCSVTVKKMW